METPPALHKPLDLVYLQSRTRKRESEIQRDVPLRPLPSRSVGLGELGPRSRCSTGLTQMPRTGNAAISRPAETAWSLCFVTQEPGRTFTCRRRIQLNARVGCRKPGHRPRGAESGDFFSSSPNGTTGRTLRIGTENPVKPVFRSKSGVQRQHSNNGNLGLLFSRRNAKRKS